MLLILLGLIATGAFREVRTALVLKREEEAQRLKIAELEKKKSELEQKLLSFDLPEGVEREAKERLNYKKPGEEVVVVLSQDAASSSMAAGKTFWDRIKSALDQFFFW